MATVNKPVDQSDVTAIQVAEVRATHNNVFTPGSVTALAPSLGATNAMMNGDEDNTSLSYILTNASDKLTVDKLVTRQDAIGVMVVERGTTRIWDLIQWCCSVYGNCCRDK